jgi:PD-(D/E)XK nuclease superfamily
MAILTDNKQKLSGSHWYTAGGDPCHHVPKAKGEGLRPTTIRDARTKGLLPSVTNILSVIAKPGLDKWKLNQVALAAYKSPANGQESAEYYCGRIIEAAFDQVVEAADLGSRIHDALEAILEGRPVDDDLRVYVEPCIKWKQDRGLTFSHREVVLVNTVEGYAGRCDVLGHGKAGQLVVIDYKTRKTKPGEDCTAYDGQGAQLAAYAVAHFGEDKLDQVHAANCYISTTEPGRFEVYKHPDLRAEWEYFKAACAIWRKVKAFDPRKGAA